MDKKSLISDMKRFTGASFITRKQVAEWMGKKDAHCVDRYLHGLDRVGQLYFIPDVVDAVIATREWR